MTSRLSLSIFLVAFFLNGCGAGEPGPSEKEIRKAALLEMPGFFELDDFKIEASQNVGTEVEPVYRMRLRGALNLREPLYAVEERVLGQVILAEVLGEGARFGLFGIAEAKMELGKWVIEFEDVKLTPRIAGEPLSSFDGGQFVFSGTEDEIKLREEQERQREIAQQQREEQLERERQADTERRAAARAEENKRLEIFQRIVANGQTVNGESGNRRDSWPFRLTFADYDDGDDSFGGRIEFPTINSAARIEGTIVGSTLTFTTVERTEGTNLVINLNYSFDSIEDNRAKGQYRGRHHGWVWMALPGT